MKKIQILFILIISTFTCFSQGITLIENQPAILYSLPKSIIQIDIELEKTNQKPGMYYAYSERYLATNQIVLEEKTSFRLKSALLKTFPVADSKRTYIIQPNAKSALNQISVNEKGILCGVNVPCKPVQSPDYISVYKNNEPLKKNALLPLGEEFMMAGSVAKLAEGAAKQIYRIRESRMSLLTGDLEHAPADGASFQAMLDGLNKAENELTELFVGKTASTTERISILVNADTVKNQIVAFRLSAHKGIVDADDLSGAPYYINIATEKIKTAVSEAKPQKAEIQTINTIYPAKASIELTDGVNSLCNISTELPQFGVIVPLSADVFGAKNLKIHVDPTNGRLLCIEK